MLTFGIFNDEWTLLLFCSSDPFWGQSIIAHWSLLMLLVCCESNARQAQAGLRRERLSCNNKHYCYGINLARPGRGGLFTRGWQGGDNLIIIRTIQFQYLPQNINIGFRWFAKPWEIWNAQIGKYVFSVFTICFDSTNTSQLMFG